MREYVIEDRADQKFAEYIKEQMMTNVPANTTTKTLLPISKVFANVEVEDLGEGIRSALASLSINQNVFSIRHRGVSEELPPNQLRQVEIVIVKSAKTQSKAFWFGGFNPQDNRSPTCWSSNSLTPDQQVEAPVSKTCATCPNDAFVTNPNGLKQKLCGDSKRLAIVPAGDLDNAAYGGAMIFRIPAGSLGALDKYGSELKKFGIPYYAYTTWVTLTIDQQKNVTKLVFEPGRPLSDEECLIIQRLRDDEKSGRIVNEAILGYEQHDDELPNAAPPVAAAPVQQARPAAPQQARPAAPQQARANPQSAQAQVARPAAPVVRPTQATTINEAVSRPATPPTTQRTVVQSPPVEETTEIPDEMNELFGDLMNR